MLRITVELLPGGSERDKRTLDVMEIGNVSYEPPSRENEYGNIASYLVFGHKRNDGFWELIRKALSEPVPIDKDLAECISGAVLAFKGSPVSNEKIDAWLQKFPKIRGPRRIVAFHEIKHQLAKLRAAWRGVSGRAPNQKTRGKPRHLES